MATGAPIPMPTDPAALLTLTQWLSPAYPVGAFSYSHGLEWAVESGDVRDRASFGDWLTDILAHGAGRNDAILLAAAYRARTPAETDRLARALTPSRERLAETTLQGAAFARATAAIWGTPPDGFCYPVAVGVAARRCGLPLRDTLALFLHGFAGNLCAAAMRLVPLGQSDGQAVLAASTPLCRALAEKALTETPDDIAGCVLAADIASMKHETQETRLFQS